MAESVSPPDNGIPKDNRSFGKSKWRGKLFANESIFRKSVGHHESNDEDLTHFLQSSTPKPEAGLTKSVIVPRIDTSNVSKRPSAPEDEDIAPPKDIYRTARPRQNKGLQVRFVSSAPDIIGEGGDEAETPPVHVSEKKNSIVDTLSFRPVSLQRTPTERAEAARDRLAVTTSEPQDEGERPISVSSLEKHKLFRRPSRDIGDYFPHNNRSDEEPPHMDTADTCSNEAVMDTVEHPSNFTRSPSLLKPPLPSKVDTSDNSLTPRASPEPASTPPRASSPERGNLDIVNGGQAPTGKSLQLSPSRIEQGNAAVATEVKTNPISLRAVAKNIGLDALDDFAVKVGRFNEIFRLGVAVHQDPMEIPLSRWIRTATWWFLKGRGELESAVRSKPRSADIQDFSGPTDIGADLKQAYLDLAKAWWIVKDITPYHPHVGQFGNTSMLSMVPIIRSFGDPDLAYYVETHVSLVANMRALAMSMKRNGRLPPETFEIQRLDARVLFESPCLPSDVSEALSFPKYGSRRGAAVSLIPLGDTEDHFTFNRTFGVGSLTSRHHSWDTILMPCIVSILRAKDSLNLSALISSQDGSLDIRIGPEKTKGIGLGWKDVHWGNPGIYVAISPGIDLCVQTTESDFKALWNICDYTRKVQKDSQGREGEELMFEAGLQDFQCLQSTRHPSSFPPNPVKACRVKLFAMTQMLSDGSSRRRIHTGHRLMVTTPAQAKSLCSVSQVYGDGMPTIFGFGRRGGAPKLALRVPNSSQLILTFENWDVLDLFYNTFTQRQTSKDEARSASLALQDFNISLVPNEDHPSGQSTPCLPDHRWQQVKVISRGRGNYHQPSTPSERSQSLRIIAQCEQGILTDRINLAPGELQMSLSVNNCNEIKLLRTQQRDLFLALTDHELADRTLENWRDLHTFEALVTGFEVAFEGQSQLTPALSSVATHFAISRRRKGVPLYKHWEADFARIQILRQDKTIQLLAFFKDFSHGACMNFVLKVTDVFETSTKSGQYLLRIVDAKFALPKRSDDPTREFVCLDMPEYPSEHDDITIGFHDENERDKFAGQLPAEISKASRMGSLKR
ncbi:MAG: hypothetical protein Q9217_003603 [Psora testacea]